MPCGGGPAGPAPPAFIACSAPDAWQADPAQGFAQQALDARVSELWVLTEFFEHRADLTLSKAEAAQCREELGLNVEGPGLQHLAVVGAICMAKSNAHVGVVFDDKVAAMCCSVMGSTDGH